MWFKFAKNYIIKKAGGEGAKFAKIYKIHEELSVVEFFKNHKLWLKLNWNKVMHIINGNINHLKLLHLNKSNSNILTKKHCYKI